MRHRSFLFLVAATLPDWGRALVKPGVLEDFSRQYGSQAVRRLNAWRELMDEISGLLLSSRLTRTNAFFNQLAFAEDVNVAKGALRPRLFLNAGVGRERTDSDNVNGGEPISLTRREAGINLIWALYSPAERGEMARRMGISEGTAAGYCGY